MRWGAAERPGSGCGQGVDTWRTVVDDQIAGQGVRSLMQVPPSLLLFDPLGQVVFDQITPESNALVRLAPIRLAPVMLALVKFALAMSA